MSSVLAVKLVSMARRNPNPSGSTSSTPSANTCSPALARFLMMANISSCLRMRPVFSISRASACLRSSDTCSALSSFRCMGWTCGDAAWLGAGIQNQGGGNLVVQPVSGDETSGPAGQRPSLLGGAAADYDRFLIRIGMQKTGRFVTVFCAGSGQLLVDEGRQLGLAHGAPLGGGELAALE